MDGTLCYPSPYCSKEFLELPLSDQHIFAQTLDFQKLCVESPLASWVSEYELRFFRKEFFQILVTARWFYMKDSTLTWLQRYGFNFDHIQFLNFNDFESCRNEKITFIQRVINNYPVEIGEELVVYNILDDDLATIQKLMRLSVANRIGAVTHFWLVENGQLRNMEL